MFLYQPLAGVRCAASHVAQHGYFSSNAPALNTAGVFFCPEFADAFIQPEKNQLTIVKDEIGTTESAESEIADQRVLDRFSDDELADINAQLENAHPSEILSWADETFGDRMIQMSSFAIDGMAIFDMFWKINPKARLATLDTMRLFEETYDLMDRIARRYNTEVEVHYPDIREVGRMIRQHGMNLFYKGVQNRQLCCEIRKVNPLNIALNEADAWITGLRRDQGMKRGDIDIVQKDFAHDAYKINPVAELDRRADPPIRPRQQSPLQHPPRQGLPLNRLRTLHTSRQPRRRRTLRTLVVGIRPRRQRMRHPHRRCATSESNRRNPSLRHVTTRSLAKSVIQMHALGCGLRK